MMLLKNQAEFFSGARDADVKEAAKLATISVSGTLGDLVKMDADQLADAMRGSDVIVFAAGAGGSDSDAMTDAIDGEGITKSIAAAKIASIRRIILVSVFPEAWRERHMDEDFEHYIIVKKRADVERSASGLDWVILRPSALKNDAGVGTVSLGLAQFHTEVRRDDVAATLATLVHTPSIRQKILELTEGPTPIADAVAAQALLRHANDPAEYRQRTDGPLASVSCDCAPLVDTKIFIIPAD